jgi:hypothetical protein
MAIIPAHARPYSLEGKRLSYETAIHPLPSKLVGTFYVEDTETRKQESLGTKDRKEAEAILNARNESVRQPHLNLAAEPVVQP